MDTCAVRLITWDASERQVATFVRVYKIDGTVLQTLPTPTGETIESIAISPDGAFVTTGNPSDLGGGATVYRVEDGGIYQAEDLGRLAFSVVRRSRVARVRRKEAAQRAVAGPFD